jgi:putative redox protein
MKVEISHLKGNEPATMEFKAITSKSSFKIIPKEISPVEIFLSGLIACSATDMILLPSKQGFNISNLNILGDVIRNESLPKKFNEIHLIYKFDSNSDNLIARRWVLSTLETYCSTINTVRGVSNIYFSIEHNGKLIANKDSILSGENNININIDNNAPDIGSTCES